MARVITGDACQTNQEQDNIKEQTDIASESSYYQQKMIVSPEVVLRTLCICCSLKSIVGSPMGNTIGEASVKYFRSSTLPEAESCLAGLGIGFSSAAVRTSLIPGIVIGASTMGKCVYRHQIFFTIFVPHLLYGPLQGPGVADIDARAV